MVFDEGAFWSYGPTHWREFKPEFMRQLASRYNGRKAGKGGDPDKPPAVIRMSASKVTGAVTSCRDKVSRSEFFASPADGVTVKNGFVTLDKVDANLELVPHSPGHKARFMIEADYDPKAIDRYPGSMLETLFNGCWKDAPDIDERIALFQEILGASLFGLEREPS